MKERLKKLAIGGAALVGLGVAYTVLILVIGRGLYCPVWKLTGLLCPGCGVTRMCLALLRLDMAAAWRANAALLLALPVLLLLAARMAVRYVRTGQKLPSRGEERVFWALLIYFLASGVLRNLMA